MSVQSVGAVSIPDCSTCPVGANTIYAPVLAEAPDVLAAARRAVLRFRPHQLIHAADTPIDQVFTLKEGWVCRVVQLPDGRRQILSFLLPGDTLCFEAIPVDDYRLPYTRALWRGEPVRRASEVWI